MASVKISRVTKSYGAEQVIHGVDLDISDGEFVVFVGPSGCGKSTLLRMIAGLEEISGGEIEIGGRVVNDVAPARRGVAMVFQTYALYPHMNVYKNMAFGLKQARTPPDEIDRRVRAAAEVLNIADYLERLPRALSGGQRQRVAIGRAIVREPEVFLFDEPLSNLDAALRVQTRLEIARLKLGFLIFESGKIGLRGPERLFLRQQEVARIAFLDRHHVAHLAKLGHAFQQNYVHRAYLTA